MLNRSMPPGTIIPVLPYPDVPAAVAWLCHTFGFRERLRIGDHRAQLTFGYSSLVLLQSATPPAVDYSLMLRVDNVDAHFAHAVKCGARIIHVPENFPYGERQYNAADLIGHRWTFSQTIADIDPQSWGGHVL